LAPRRQDNKPRRDLNKTLGFERLVRYILSVFTQIVGLDVLLGDAMDPANRDGFAPRA
jgi:hypothetical protein